MLPHLGREGYIKVVRVIVLAQCVIPFKNTQHLICMEIRSFAVCVKLLRKGQETDSHSSPAVALLSQLQARAAAQTDRLKVLQVYHVNLRALVHGKCISTAKGSFLYWKQFGQRPRELRVKVSLLLSLVEGRCISL